MAFDDAEPDFDEAHPRCPRRSEMDVDSRVPRPPLADLGPLVGGVLVNHQIQFLVWICPSRVLDEHQNSMVTVSGPANPGQLSGRDLQCRKQGGRAVADVVVGLAFGEPNLHRQRRRRPIRCLNLRFFVYTHNDLVFRRIEIHPDDVGDLRDEFRIGAKLEYFTVPGLHTVPMSRLRDSAVADSQSIG